MKAITIIERDDGGITIAGTGVGNGTVDAVRLLHLGIDAVASPPHWKLQSAEMGER